MMVNLICNGVFLLLKYLVEFSKLLENLQLIVFVIEEFLCFESLVQLMVCIVLEDCVINQYFIKKGEQVYILLGAVNCDLEVFYCFYQLDIMRNFNLYLVFGKGVYVCIGFLLVWIEV